MKTEINKKRKAHMCAWAVSFPVGSIGHFTPAQPITPPFLFPFFHMRMADGPQRTVTHLELLSRAHMSLYGGTGRSASPSPSTTRAKRVRLLD
jgi:hypothetical protein